MATKHESPVVRSTVERYDPVTCMGMTFHHHADGAVTIQTWQDVDALLERNKALYAMTDERAPWKGEGVGVQTASIPLGLVDQWIADGVIEKPADIHDKKVKRMLNSNEYKHLRTRPGDL